MRSISQGVGYTFGVPKRPCTNRAAWRLVRGQRAQRLSAHYQLECDYGTVLTGIYKEGDAVFLCDAHVTVMNRTKAGSIAGVRLIGTRSADVNDSRGGGKQGEDLPSPGKGPQALVNESEARISDESRTTDIPAQHDAAPKPSETKPQSVATRPAARGLVRDVTFGDCVKALVDEAIWNLAPGDFAAYQTALKQGKSATQAAEAAGGQLATVHRKIEEYTLRIEAILSDSRAMIGVSDVIEKQFDQAMIKIIDNQALSEAEKDAAIDHLGSFQESLSSGIGGQLSPLEAFRLAQTVGDRANWGVAPCSLEELKAAYGAVYRSLRTAVLSAVPGAHPVDERLANLCAAKRTLEIELNQKVYPVAT